MEISKKGEIFPNLKKGYLNGSHYLLFRQIAKLFRGQFLYKFEF